MNIKHRYCLSAVFIVELLIHIYIQQVSTIMLSSSSAQMNVLDSNLYHILITCVCSIALLLTLKGAQATTVTLNFLHNSFVVKSVKIFPSTFTHHEIKVSFFKLYVSYYRPS